MLCIIHFRNFSVVITPLHRPQTTLLSNNPRRLLRFLAMGFTGKRAAQFKEAYINAL